MRCVRGWRRAGSAPEARHPHVEHADRQTAMKPVVSGCRTLLGLARSIHPFPTGVVVLTTLGLALIAHRGFLPTGSLGRMLGVVLCSQIVVGSLNDYRDRHTDAISQPTKPIPSGDVGARAVLVLCQLSLISCFLLAATFGPLPLLLVVVGTMSGVAYDLWLKPTPFSIFGYLGGFLCLVSWVWLLAGHFTPTFLLVYPAGAFLLLSVHLANGYPDLESDRALGQRGLAVLLGAPRTRLAIVLSFNLVAIVGTAAVILQRSWLAEALLLVAWVLDISAVRISGRAIADLQARRHLFTLLAPATALLSAACLLAISLAS